MKLFSKRSSRIEWTPLPTPLGPSHTQYVGEYRGFTVEVWEHHYGWSWCFVTGSVPPLIEGHALFRSNAEDDLTTAIDQHIAREETDHA